LSFVLGQCEEENDDKQLLVVIFCNIIQSKKEIKLTKGVGCKVYLEVMAMAMVRWSSIRTSYDDDTIKLTLERVMALEMELCVLLLEKLDTRALGPPKM